MKNSVTLKKAREIMGKNIIAQDALKNINGIGLKFFDDDEVVPFSEEELQEKADDYILIYGCSKFEDNRNVTIRNLKTIFGDDPLKSTPCFYFQDWYNNEKFIDIQMEEKWYLIRKKVFEDSRKVLPSELIKKHEFPSAIKCTYSFFVAWLVLGEKLWYHDFVWCSDVDHNGDRIYVGKYNDVDGVNKDGFSIHRHLALRPCYGCIDQY